VCAEALDSLNDVLSSHNFAAIGKPPRLQRGSCLQMWRAAMIRAHD